MSVVLMRVLESTPARYDRGIQWLTLGRASASYDRLAAEIEPGWRVLDVGSGTGALALRAAARGAEVVAIDVNLAMLDIARQKAQAAGLDEAVTWQEVGVAEMDAFPAGSFDAVCSGMCFSELTPDERRYALDQARRVLRPGGRLLLADEVRPEGLTRFAVGLARLPLVAVTWLLTQTTTRAVPDLAGLVEGAGFTVLAARRDLGGAWMELVAVGKRSGTNAKTPLGVEARFPRESAR